MSEACVVFSHGTDGEPWGTKVSALAETARVETSIRDELLMALS